MGDESPEEIKCDECGLTAEVLADMGIEMNEEGICVSCCEEIVKEWEQERKELIKHWEDTRI